MWSFEWNTLYAVWSSNMKTFHYSELLSLELIQTYTWKSPCCHFRTIDMISPQLPAAHYPRTEGLLWLGNIKQNFPPCLRLIPTHFIDRNLSSPVYTPNFHTRHSYSLYWGTDLNASVVFLPSESFSYIFRRKHSLLYSLQFFSRF